MAHLPETVGAGCAFLDYDSDGWMDIYLVNSGPCDFFEPPQPLRNALYHNNRDGTFTDVTQKARVTGNAYGMGVAVGDYDADGFPDLYVTQYPTSILYHNNGDGTFTDVTTKAGVVAPGWATSAVWFDYNNDGRLDLFVCRFVDYSKTKLKFCGDLLTQVGDGPALTGNDLIGAAIEAEDMFGASCLTPQSAPTVRRLADLEPTTLAIMHGSSYNGDARKALHALADDYERRLAHAATDRPEGA